MPRLFVQREGAAGMLGELAVGAGVTAVGIYVSKRVFEPAAQFLSKFIPPQWAGLIGAFLVSAVLMYISEGQEEGFMKNAIQVAAYGTLGWAIAHALGWNPGPRKTATVAVSPWMTLERVPLM
ncbi:MAG: hypothetical protein QXW41_08945 [Fervidicoccaceae archaeon]